MLQPLGIDGQHLVAQARLSLINHTTDRQRLDRCAHPNNRGLEHLVVFLVLFRTALAGRGNKTFETVAKLINEFDSHLIPRHGTMHQRHHATLHRRENLHLIDLLSHANPSRSPATSPNV